MNILYINGHPYKKSFHHAIEESYVTGVDTDKHAIKTLRLGEMKFDPVLRYGYSEFMPEDADIKQSQELIKWADHLVFAYPIWWGIMPSLLSGWIARVFVPGFSYHIHSLIKYDKFLKGKTADIIVTTRAPRLMWPIMNSATKPLVYNLFFLTGIKKRKIISLDQMSLKKDTNERRKAFLTKVHDVARSL